MRTARRLKIFFLLVSLIGLATSGKVMALETANFIVRDLTGQLSNDQIVRLANGAEEKLRQILDFWGVGTREDQLGKIRLEFAKSREGTYATVFITVKEGDRRVRVVRIYGVLGEPEMVAHKLTHAVFPTADKLIRNMMGIPMEVRFGNPFTFPMCGFGHDTWVAVFRQNGTYLPLSELGPDHEQWGMTTKDGVPFVLNKPRQHIMYAESGSFGSFLLAVHGPNKVKRFYHLSSGMKRPWEEVFGMSLPDLEKQWLHFLDTRPGQDSGQAPMLMRMVQDSPANACVSAQEKAGKKVIDQPTQFHQRPMGPRRSR